MGRAPSAPLGARAVTLAGVGHARILVEAPTGEGSSVGWRCGAARHTRKEHQLALPELPTSFASTRESLRALACYVISPARKARTGRIGLRPTGDGFGTPPFEDGSRLRVSGDQLVQDPKGAVTISTLPAAAAFVGVELSADPGVGHDLPPYEPGGTLVVDRDASLVLGTWYAFSQQVLDELRNAWSAGTIGEAQLWPEHFDLAVTIELAEAAKVNVGFSPGDSFSSEPYAYVGPHHTEGLLGPFWNAPFGAYLPYGPLRAAEDSAALALGFVMEGLTALS